MDWIVVVFLAILALCVLLITVTLASLPKLGDERSNFIKMKAQSYAFTIVITLAFIEIMESIYLTIWTENTYKGMNPLTFLAAISAVYLISLLFSKKKYSV